MWEPDWYHEPEVIVQEVGLRDFRHDSMKKAMDSLGQTGQHLKKKKIFQSSEPQSPLDKHVFFLSFFF